MLNRGIFLFGMERSGTTLLSMLVGAHPEIAVPLATAGLWYSFDKRQKEYNRLRDPNDLRRLVDDIIAHDRIQRWDERLDVEDVLPRCQTGDYSTVVAAFHSAYARAKGKSLWANMDIATLDQLHRANELFPDAKFVHIYRDARDVALSNLETPYSKGNLAECADNWSRRLTLNFRMGRILGPDRYLAVSYEDVIQKPESTLGEVCDFVGVKYSHSMLQYGGDAAAKVPKDRQWLWLNMDGSLDRSAVQRWRRDMPTSKRIVVERYAGRLLDELGYEVYRPLPWRAFAELLDIFYFLERGRRFKRFLTALGVRPRSTLERRWGRAARGAQHGGHASGSPSRSSTEGARNETAGP